VIALADVNVLVALIWESHLHHTAARRWFATQQRDGWATCSVTQAGFVRVSSNPRVLQDAISVTQAVATLAAAIATPGHHLLTDGAGFVDNPLVPHDRLVGHQQVTDALLVAIAKQHHATLATLDGGLSSLAPDCVTLIPTGS